MAGSEVMGIRGAKKDMLEGAVWALSFSTNAGEDVRRSAEDFVEVFKSRPLIIEPERHDRIVAATSHVPLLCAAAMATVVGNEAESDELVWALASGGFRDTTRVASGSPKMGAGIDLRQCGTDKAHVEEIDIGFVGYRRDFGRRYGWRDTVSTR